MTAGQGFLDAPLAGQQPVHGGIEFLLVGIRQAEGLAQRRRGGLFAQSARGGQLGAGVDHAGDDEGHHQVALPAGPSVDDLVQADPAQRAQDGSDVTVREGPNDLEPAAGVGDLAALEQRAQPLDDVGGPVGQIGQGTIAGLATLAVGLAEQDARWGATVGYGCNVHD